MAATRTTHGMRHTREYVCWRNMRIRCEKPNSISWPYYGGRGIRVAPEFRTFEGFFAVLGRCPNGYTLDRVNVNGHYEPGNVRWADKATQHRNRRDNVFLTHDSETLTITDWSARTGIPIATLWRRVRIAKWDVAKALTTPVLTSSQIGRLGSDARWH